MADKRMFSRGTLHATGFLSLTPSAKNLYIFLSLEADDDGFVMNALYHVSALKIRRSALRELSTAGLIYIFPSGVLVIRHFRAHNNIRRDTYKPSQAEERELLWLDKSGVYYLDCDIPEKKKSAAKKLSEGGAVSSVATGEAEADTERGNGYKTKCNSKGGKREDETKEVKYGGFNAEDALIMALRRSYGDLAENDDDDDIDYDKIT